MSWNKLAKSPGKCVECFKVLPDGEIICDRCMAIKSGDLEHLQAIERTEKEKNDGSKYRKSSS